jgi:hypothetical protein
MHRGPCALLEWSRTAAGQRWPCWRWGPVLVVGIYPCLSVSGGWTSGAGASTLEDQSPLTPLAPAAAAGRDWSSGVKIRRPGIEASAQVREARATRACFFEGLHVRC